ncbi:hypothetical protein EN804_31295 [Mesorhizobium sp. M8A.F.Ca.ET.161.01.1.1]|nr:hypothetical protein EOA36_07720 [Mesorhizobium sp. M8A.F.Ca.ET.021.01.1.1]TGP98365.1 hypothetical protein EN861_07785 [Mesorhizobium sp. M8A.F.Ca.ET.218.01.1.1]TGR24974.1 hypothetical protein EN840_16770 [Mesorhizobium sp. M8A.F.Ca.ET.197.01.1.1]TGR25428.1 hypothetical protein EN845_16570 [Mesorhizobium sp. M8A.F.Ca.ET.202.01.1.1]TGR40434.1 hypothetical protein EN842_36795 [bacterium M00.F.Ca.ET.199.01.1.1]TGR49361.1 hypothetical protein EN841_16760 [Mesorhizobium sp. M8A.F.Ca.ET.198.01.1.
MAQAPSSGRFAATFSPRGEEFASVGVSLFSPAGRRWPEGPDEGAGTEKRERAFCTVRRHE